MINDDLKQLVFLIEKVNTYHRKKAITKEIVNEQIESIDAFTETIEEIKKLLKSLKSIDLENICEVGERLILIRSQLLDCQALFNDLAVLVEKTFLQFDYGDC